MTRENDPAHTGFKIWRVYDAGGPDLRLKIRYRDDVELPDWQDGLDLLTAFERAAWSSRRARLPITSSRSCAA